MPITIKDINDKVFTKQVRGYSIEEVDDFLDELAAQMETLIRESQAMARQLEEAQKAVAEAQSAAAEAPAAPVVEEKPAVVEPAPAVVETVAVPMADVESQYYKNLRETLVNAQRMADATVADAKQKANSMIAEAEEKSAEITASARAEVEAAQAECTDIRGKISDYRARFQKMVAEQIKVLDLDGSLFE